MSSSSLYEYRLVSPFVPPVRGGRFFLGLPLPLGAGSLWRAQLIA